MHKCNSIKSVEDIKIYCGDISEAVSRMMEEMLPFNLLEVEELRNVEKYKAHHAKLNDYSLLTVLGKGAFGQVFLASKPSNEEEYNDIENKIDELESTAERAWSLEEKKESRI